MIMASVASMAASAPPTPTPPVAAFIYNPPDPQPGGLTEFLDQTTNDPTSWSWSINGSQFSIQQNPTMYFSLPGDYTVSLTATNFFGSSTNTQTVQVRYP